MLCTAGRLRWYITKAVAASSSNTPVASIRLVFWERGIRRGKGDGITRTPFRGDSALSLRVKLAVSARVKRGATEGSNPQDKSFQSDVWYQRNGEPARCRKQI